MRTKVVSRPSIRRLASPAALSDRHSRQRCTGALQVIELGLQLRHAREDELVIAPVALYLGDLCVQQRSELAQFLANGLDVRAAAGAPFALRPASALFLHRH